MDVIAKIDSLMQERNWTDYRLAQESGLASSTIANLRRRHTVPSIATLESICNAFGITLSQFFAEGDSSVSLSDEQRQMFKNWDGAYEGAEAPGCRFNYGTETEITAPLLFTARLTHSSGASFFYSYTHLYGILPVLLRI